MRVSDDFLEKKKINDLTIWVQIDVASLMKKKKEKKTKILTFVLHSIASFTAAATALSLMSISSMAFREKENKNINSVYDCLVTVKRCNRSINDQMAPRSLIFVGQYTR